MVIVERNKEVATEVQNRLRSVSVENQELLKLVGSSSGVAAHAAQDRIKRTNRVLRSFVTAVKKAESVHTDLKTHISQTITAHEEQLSAVRVGDTHYLVQDEKFASFDFDDISALSGDNLNLNTNLFQLRNAADEIEEQMNVNHSTLVDVGAAKHYSENRDGSFGYTTASDRWTSSTGTSSWDGDSVDASTRSIAANRRFQYQRNIAIIVSIIATLGAAGLLILYFLKR